MCARAIFQFLMGFMLGCACLSVTAQELTVQTAVFEDPHGGLTLAQVQKAEFIATGKIIGRGYTRATVWVRLRVEAPKDTQRVKLRIVPAQLENVTLFTRLLPGEGQPLSESTAWIPAEPGLNFIYLRVQTSGPMLLQPRLFTEEQAHREDVARGFILGAVLACYAPLLVGLLVLIAARRQILHIAFLLNLSLAVGSFLGWTGYLSEILGSTHWVAKDATIYFLGVANIFTGFFCVFLLLDCFGLPRWGKVLLTILGIPYVILCILFFVLDRQLVLQISTAFGLVASILTLILTTVVFYRQKTSGLLVGAILFCALALGVRWFMTVHALVPAVDSLADLFLFRIFFGMSFLLATLWLIDRERKGQLQISIMNEAMARQQAESESLRRENQERFMTMLMHELKTPLSIIQLAAASLGRRLAHDSGDATRVGNINRAVDDLNALVERCAAADQFDQGALQIQKQALCLATLVKDVLQTLDATRVRVSGSTQYQVYSDVQYLRLILINLLGNALKYSPADSRIELLIEPTASGTITLRVTNIVGVAGTPDPARVFTRYYRTEGAKRQVGAGLGLWLSQSLARQLGAELQFENNNEEICFSFSLELA